MSQPLLPEIPQEPERHSESEDRLRRFAQFRHLGMKRAEISRLMGITPQTHDRWLEHPWVVKFSDELNVKQETRILLLKDRLNTEALNLVDELLEMSRNPDAPFAARAQIKQDLLDREGSLPKRTHVESSGERKVFSDEQFEKLMGGILDSAARGTVVLTQPSSAELPPGDS